MSKQIRKAPEGVLSILKSSDPFAAIAGKGDFSKRMKGALKSDRLPSAVTGDAYSSGFGGQPRFNPSSGFDTIKSDPDAYSKILRGGSRKTKTMTQRYAQRTLGQAHRTHRPRVDEKMVAKYSRKHHAKRGTAQVAKALRREKAGPSVALYYASGVGSLSLVPTLVQVVKGPRQVAKLLRSGELALRSMVRYDADPAKPMFLPAYGVSRLFSRG
ncbi:MAG: hypothetical protein U1F66_07605 [bacterium]